MIKKDNRRTYTNVKTRNNAEPLGTGVQMVVHERGKPTEERRQDLEGFILIFKRKEAKYRTARQSLERELFNLVMRGETEKILTSDRTKIEEKQ